MVKTNTLPDDDIKQNEQDERDIAQKLYEREFNAIQEHYDEEAESDQEDESIAKVKGTHVDSHGDVVDDNPESDDADLARQALAAQEDDPLGASLTGQDDMLGSGGGRRRGLFKGFGRNISPTMGLTGILVLAIGGGSSLILGGASLLVMMTSVLTNANSMDTKFNHLVTKGRLAPIFNFSNRDCGTSKIKCKVTEMGSRDKARWEKKGATIDANRSLVNPLNHKVRGMQITIEGKTYDIRNSNDWRNAMRDPAFRRVAWQVSHPWLSSFIEKGNKFTGKILTKYKKKLSDTFRTSKAKDKQQRTQEMNESMDERTGADTDQNNGADAKKKRLLDRVKGSSAVDSARKKIGKLSNPAEILTAPATLVCSAYTLARVTIATVKLQLYKDLFSFFLPFFQISDETKLNALGIGPPVETEKVEYIGDRLTWYDNREEINGQKNEKHGLTATDSQGFQAAMYGDFGALKDFTKQYAPWWAINAIALSGFVGSVQNKFGKENIRSFCVGARVASAIATVGSAVACAGPQAVVCVAGIIAGLGLGYIFGDDIAELAISEMTDEALKRIADMNLNSSLKGVDLGNAIAAAVGLFLMEKNRASGLRPATSAAAVTSYLAAVEPESRELTELAREEARKDPFDITNHHSFVGQLALILNSSHTLTMTPFGVISNIPTISTLPMKLFSSKAKAVSQGIYQPIEMIERPGSLEGSTRPGEDRAGDQQMAEIGVLSTWTGQSVDVVDPEVIGWLRQMENGDPTPWFETVDYMKNTKYENDSGEMVGMIDDDGKPTGYDQYNKNPDADNPSEKDYKNDYLMDKAYCSEDRIYPLGTSEAPLDNFDIGKRELGYRIGTTCAGNDLDGNPDPKMKEKNNRFTFYRAICEGMLGIENGSGTCWEVDQAAATVNTGDWIAPVTAPCTSPYGPRSGVGDADGFHNGVDIGGSMGTPILAPTSVKIVTVQNTARNPSGGNTVVAKATDGTDYGFIFMHMQNEPPADMIGKEFSKGAEIGKVGNSGTSAPHLHMEVYPPGVDPASFDGDVDPQDAFAQNGVDLGCGVGV